MERTFEIFGLAELKARLDKIAILGPTTREALEAARKQIEDRIIENVCQTLGTFGWRLRTGD